MLLRAMTDSSNDALMAPARLVDARARRCGVARARARPLSNARG
jgi:hypothetical protein